MTLRIEIPGNPWRGAINRRDRAAVSRSGKPYNRKQAGFAAYQHEVELWARQAARAQRRRFGAERVRLTIVLGVPDQRRRDIDGPIKAILDGLTDAGVWDDDSQVWDLLVSKVLGEPRSVVLVERLTPGPDRARVTP